MRSKVTHSYQQKDAWVPEARAAYVLGPENTDNALQPGFPPHLHQVFTNPPKPCSIRMQFQLPLGPVRKDGEQAFTDTKPNLQVR